MQSTKYQYAFITFFYCSMKFFLQNDNTSKEVDLIMKQLRLHMDGDVSHQMGQHGLNYQLNYGSSLLWIKDIAKPYKYNQELAERLWLRECRETMLIASMIAEAEKFDKEKLNQWFELVHTNEIAEQFGIHLLSRINNLEEILIDWSHNSNTFKKAAYWVALSIKIRNNENVDVDTLLQRIENSLSHDSTFLQRIKGRFLRALCRNSEENLAKVESLLTKIAEDMNLAFLAQELKSEVEFIKENNTSK